MAEAVLLISPTVYLLLKIFNQCTTSTHSVKKERTIA